MKFSIVQYSPEWENIENNILTVRDILKDKLTDETALIFPEMTLTGFTMQSEKFAEEEDGVSLNFFLNLAKEINKHIFAGYIEKFDGKIYNTLLHVDNQGLIHAKYRKIHPFSYAKENQHYHRGSETVMTSIDNVNAGLTICYDLRFPELYRLYAKQNADVIVNIANWPEKRIKHWKVLLQARAIENQCFIIGVNRTGNDPGLVYPGNSAVFDPMGEELLMTDNIAGLYSVDLDISKSAATKESLPFLRDISLI